jgi:mRNA interferase RelE/StbE
MTVRFLSSFEKDLYKVSPAIRHKVVDLVTQIETVSSIREVSQVKKLRGFKEAYRVRIGDFRLGFLLQGGTVTFVRLLDRKSIYRVFP